MSKRRLVLAIAFIAPLTLSTARADISLTFGVDASDKPSAMVEQLRPTLDLVEQVASPRLGEPVKIRMRVVRDYQEGVNALVSGQVDFARLGPASYVQAKQKSSAVEILAVEQLKGKKEFNGVICVAAESPLRTIAELRGHSFAFGADDSTIGRYLAQLYLSKNGVHAGDLKSFSYLGRHDRVGEAVASGQFDAGALEETVFKQLVQGGAKIKAIATFPNATKTWVARPGLSMSIRASLTQGLLAVNDPNALAALRFDGFLDGNDQDYDLIRESINENGRFFAQRSIGN
jgi:phosphonate transport system substrate-binding protein